MEKENIVCKYHGINIIKSCGKFYPSVNGNIECDSVYAVKKWIREVWLFVENNLNELDNKMNLPKGSSMNFIHLIK